MKAKRRLIEAIVIGAVAPLLLTALVSSPALAAGNATTVGSLQLTATFVNISVYANFSDDDNGNNTAILEWRESGGTWKPGMALTVDRRQTIYDRLYYNGVGPNPFRNQWRGSVLGVQPDTEYEVRVTFNDPDGVTGTNPITSVIRTRKDSFPLGTGNTYYVATTGSNTNPGTEALPWATLSKAASSVSAGDTVYFKAGTYNESLVILNHSGTASNYITIMNYGTDIVIFNGGNAEEILRLDGASYIRIHGFTFTNAVRYLVRLVHSSNYNVIENCTFYDFGDHVPDGAIVVTLRSAYNVIQSNYIYNTANRANYGDQRHRASGISLTYWSGLVDDAYGPGEGQVIRYNRIQGGASWQNGALGDGVGGDENDDIQNGIYKDTDVYQNDIWDINSEGVECEGGNINCRVWGNTIHSSYTDAISWAPCKIGPLFVWRNVTYDLNSVQELGYKVGWQTNYGGRTYVYHNTMYIPRYVGTEAIGVGDWGGTGGTSNQVYRNNIRRVTRWVTDFQYYVHDMDLDYECLYNEGDVNFWRWNGTNYTTLTSVQGSLGQELHGISTDPLFTNPSSADFTLQQTSPCIDKGVLLPGFNDANSPWPYKGSAPDMGCFEYPTYHLSLDVKPKEIATISGEGWYTGGTVVSIGPAPEAILSSTGTRYTFDRWIVNGVERMGNPISITIDSPHQVVAQYKVQYYLSVASEYGSPSGIGWYNTGTLVTISPAQELILGNASTRHVFSKWIVDGFEKTDNPISITMDSPHQVATQYETQHYLSVESKYGNSQGNGWYYSDSTAEFSVPATFGLIVQHLFTGWNGDSTADTPVASIVMDGPKTVIANWRTDYSRLCIVIGIVVVLIGVISVVVARRRKKLPSL